MIDAHHHLWSYSAGQYPWIPEGSELAKHHLLGELHRVTAAAGVEGTIVVQARQSIDESDFLLGLAARSPSIRGVVGWVPLIDVEVECELERLSPDPKFKGVRHVLQDEDDSYFLRDDFHRGLALLPKHQLTFDLLIFQRQLSVALELVDRQPELSVVINHIAKPRARNGRIEEEWRRGMRELAKRENVLGVKFSGLLTEFPAGDIERETVAAYFNETLEILGPDRVMFGSDWPVCLLRTSYCDWIETLRELAAGLAEGEEQALLRSNAERVYRL